jgi:hypothetical protein
LNRSLLSSQPAPIILYHLASSVASPDLLSAVHIALVSLLPANPVLFTRFTGVHSASPGLAFLPAVDVTKMVVRMNTSGWRHGGYGVYLDDILEKTMAEVKLVALSEEQGKETEDEGNAVLPPWRVLLAQQDPPDGKGFYIGLIGHQTLFDGLALLNLTSSLLTHLSSSLSSSFPLDPSMPSTIPLSPDPTFPPTLDSLIPLKPSLLTLLPIIYREILLPSLPLPAFLRYYLTPSPAPRAWLGPGTPRPHPRRKRHYTHTISAQLVGKLLKRCEEEKTSLTSVLHTVVGRALGEFVAAGDERPIRGNTAISLRPRELAELAAGAYVGGFAQTVPRSSSQEKGPGSIWDVSRAHLDCRR